MYDPDYYDFDEDGNPEFHGHGPPKEEPDCGACNDRGAMPSRFRRSGWRRCCACRPNRFDRIRSAVFWRYYNSRLWTWRHRHVAVDDPPF